MTFAHWLARTQTVVIITLFYFLIISPLGFLMVLFGWDPLEKRGFKKSARTDTQLTNWKEVKKPKVDVSDMGRMS